jgi:amino acid adenylation domain-containing protein
MTIEDFLSDLRRLDVRLWAEGDRLRYSAPKRALTPELYLKLQEHKTEVLTFLQQANQVLHHSSVGSIKPVSRDKNLPLSFAQTRLWFLEQLEPGNVIYNIPTAMRLSGKLNIAALQQTFNEIVRRHEVLRTTFAIVEGQPVQMTTPNLTLTFPIVNLQEVPEIEREVEVQKLVNQQAQQPFSLERGPLLRITLLQLNQVEHVLLLVMHHIVSDGWSIEVLIKEVAALYEAFTAQKPSPLQELPIQYADFAYWQRQWLTGKVLKTQLDYWQQQLAGALPVLELPTDYPRPVVQTFRGKSLSLSLSKKLSEKLKVLSQHLGVTLFMALLAAFQTLLYRYTGQSDICVGSPIANRNHSEIEQLIGFFVNTLLLRTNFEGNPSFSELLSQVREVTLGAYAHQELPFEQLVELQKPERSLSHHPLFQVMFVLQNAPIEPLELPELTITPLNSNTGTTKFDLSLAMAETEQGLVGSLEYNTDLFDAATITQMQAQFQNLLEGIVANPYQLLADLPLLTEPERQQLLVEWNHTEVDYSNNLCIHQLFEAQVERTPDAVAVVFEDQQLTYRELNCRSNRLADHLRTLGVRPEVLVGICVERSLEMVVGILGTLKAGGAYVPIDPAYPQERIAFVLEDTQVPVLLTQAHLLEILLKHQTKVICLDTDWGDITLQSAEKPVIKAIPENLAYVIYTSGSTGQPKGVMNTHQGLCNRLLWMQNTYKLTAADRVLQKTPFSFDVSVWEFFWSLLTGACLVFARPDGHKDTAYLARLIAEERITTLHFVPSMLQVFLEEAKLEESSCIRRVICSGEALPFELQARFFASLDTELHNLYGPTEAAIDVTFWQCKRKSNLRIVPIGRPIANTQIYILNQHLQPVPIGARGELYIGGINLARGYVNRPDLTALKFIPNPFSKKPGAFLYKTGDLARYLKDGNIEYLGRLDYQVKIRGFRIEIGEIEAALVQHPAVREAVVIALEDKPDNKRLIAYIVSYQKHALTTTELRHFLKNKLPEYMVPSVFMLLDSLPLTSNGKINRRALPSPEGIRPELTVEYVAPQSEVEQMIASIWQEVLEVEKVGVYDNFFDIGGNSLLVIQVHSKLCQLLNRELSVIDLFQHPTISTLANYCSQQNKQLSFSDSHDRTQNRKNLTKQQKQFRQKHQAMNNLARD